MIIRPILILVLLLISWRCNAQNGVNVYARIDADVKKWQANFVPKDPWRVYLGSTNFYGGGKGYQFSGKVLSVTTNGVVLEGWASVPCAYLKYKLHPATLTLLHFTHPVRIGQLLAPDEKWVAVSFNGKVLDYGAVTLAPGTQQ
jgi:hypothetical protein